MTDSGESFVGHKSQMMFSVVDYLVFFIMLLVSASIGVYFGFFAKKMETTADYLLGDRKMRPIPIAISLVASQLSGIAIISIPAEIYAHGPHYAWIIPDVVFVVTPIMCYLFVHIFYTNNISNCYETSHDRRKMDAASESVLEASGKFVFSWIDYVVFVLMLAVSAGIGVYFGFFNKGADTTDEYLMGGKRMKTLPIAISLIASQLSGMSVMTLPAEMYSFGIHYSLIVPAMFAVVPLLCFIVVPVFYVNNISNCYEYLEMRFDKKTRQIVTISFISTVILIIPVIIFIPALAFAQVTGINIHLINSIVCAVCVFYTMLGGIKAVVWTDVIQASIMLGSCILVAGLGVYTVGGFGEVLTRAHEGGRLDVFNMDLDPQTRTTFWNCLIGGIFLWSGYVGLNQSCVQRIVSLPSLSHARRSLFIFAGGFFVIMTLNCFTGVIMYARYYGCDPVKAGLVEKPDKLMPFFVQDIVGHLKGMPGVFISCVFSAALSTMSANLNTLSGIMYFDYVKPFIKHTEARANMIMKLLVVIIGIYCVIGGLVVEKFASILQMVITISGISQGAVVGVFTLGMLYPRAHSKGAFWGTALSMICLTWIIIGAQVAIRNGNIKYDPLPTTVDHCDALNFTVTESAMLSIRNLNHTSTNTADDSFSIYKISFNYYTILGAVLVWLFGVPISHIFKGDPEKKFNINLISPIARSLVPLALRHTEVPLQDMAFIKH